MPGARASAFRERGARSGERMGGGRGHGSQWAPPPRRAASERPTLRAPAGPSEGSARLSLLPEARRADGPKAGSSRAPPRPREPGAAARLRRGASLQPGAGLCAASSSLHTIFCSSVTSRGPARCPTWRSLAERPFSRPHPGGLEEEDGGPGDDCLPLAEGADGPGAGRVPHSSCFCPHSCPIPTPRHPDTR